ADAPARQNATAKRAPDEALLSTAGRATPRARQRDFRLALRPAPRRSPRGFAPGLQRAAVLARRAPLRTALPPRRRLPVRQPLRPPPARQRLVLRRRL